MPCRFRAGQFDYQCYGAELITAGVTTQVSRLARIEAAQDTWTDKAWTVLAAFIGPRVANP